MREPFVPDLSSRPFSMIIEREMKAAANSIYDAWTEGFDNLPAALETLDEALRE